MRSRLLIINASLALCSLLQAATPTLAPGDYARQIWRSEDGLPQNKIQALTQTRDGFLWIGTSGGLVRFDGIRFTVFDRSNAPALRDDSITTLRPAHDGSLWIGTEGGGNDRRPPRRNQAGATVHHVGIGRLWRRALGESLRRGRAFRGTGRRQKQTACNNPEKCAAHAIHPHCSGGRKSDTDRREPLWAFDRM